MPMAAGQAAPALQVTPERQSFKCWVCDIGGEVFSFIMKDGRGRLAKQQLLADKAASSSSRKTYARRPRNPDDAPDRLKAWPGPSEFHVLLDAPGSQAPRDYWTPEG